MSFAVHFLLLHFDQFALDTSSTNISSPDFHIVTSCWFAVQRLPFYRRIFSKLHPLGIFTYQLSCFRDNFRPDVKTALLPQSVSESANALSWKSCTHHRSESRECRATSAQALRIALHQDQSHIDKLWSPLPNSFQILPAHYAKDDHTSMPHTPALRIQLTEIRPLQFESICIPISLSQNLQSYRDVATKNISRWKYFQIFPHRQTTSHPE